MTDTTGTTLSLLLHVVLFALVEAVMIGAATIAVVRIWFKKNGPFTYWRARAEATDGWIGRLALCSFCLPFWITGFLTIAVALSMLVWPSTYVVHGILVWLSATTLVHEGNMQKQSTGVLYPYSVE